MENPDHPTENCPNNTALSLLLGGCAQTRRTQQRSNESRKQRLEQVSPVEKLDDEVGEEEEERENPDHARNGGPPGL